MKIFYSFLLIFFIVSFLGCANHSKEIVKSNDKQKNANYSLVKHNGRMVPSWVLSPSKNGKIGGVGKCGFHVNGYTAQKELATERALEDIARQKGVEITSSLKISSQGSNYTNMPSTVSESKSEQRVMNTGVKAHIEEIWQDEITKDLYIYMIED